ncbi:hypothetical protein LM604_08600, partial [Candidatus Acetothermia bacterium]|nr:hypothetical protein [Candidatus Acetothermia bacterium]
MNYSVAEIAVCLNLDQALDYRIPERLRPHVRIGQRVRVPVREQRDVEGFIVALKEHSSVGLLRELSAIVSPEPTITERDLKLARWISEYYLTPLGLVLAMMVPALTTSAPRTIQYAHSTLSLSELIQQIERLSLRAPQQAALLKTLLSLENPTVTELLERVRCGPGPLKALTEAKIIQITKKPKAREEYREPLKTVTLSSGQSAALNALSQALSSEKD